jgi:cholesterol oxidase
VTGPAGGAGVEMKAAYDAVVIGSGFGGAVSACRLAQAGLDVLVLERGRRYAAGSFPRDLSDPARGGWLWPSGQGLFDLRPLNDVLVVQAAGYGGGSLVYANVAYRPPADLFARGWPDGYSRPELDPYYDLAAYMLDVTPISATQPRGLPPKTVLIEKAAANLGRSPQFFLPNLAVNFGEPGVARPNKFGVSQAGCVHCAECDIGCNIHAKNTLDLNYLAVAEQHGASVVTQCEVSHVAAGADGYTVYFRDHAGGTDGQASAPEVFVCAGAVNSTELLLRSRDQYGGLPSLSERLGDGYSANGDFLAFALGTSPEPYLPGSGPVITTGIVYDDKSATDRTWFVFEDGGCPPEVASLLQVLGRQGRWRADGAVAWDDVARAAGDRIGDLTGRLVNDGDRAAVFLVMGRDRANGVIEYLPAADHLRVRWDVPASMPLYALEAAFCNDVASELGGRYVPSPQWEYLRQPVSVHNLGGCLMAASPADGVVDPDGEVFGYPGLHVLDGAILPMATGANPSHTIAAVTERCIERAIRRITGNAQWSAPERAQAGPVVLPEDAVTIPDGGTPPPRTPVAGMSFTETMRGTLTLAGPPGGDVPAAAWPPAASQAVAPGEAALPRELAASFRVTIASSDLAMLLADPVHPATAAGTVWLDGFTGPKGARIVGGSFNLFTDADGLYRRKMLYSLPFYGADGRYLILQGCKEVWDHGHFDVWGSTTTLYASLVDAGAPGRPALAQGVLRLTLPMFARQLTTMRITGASSPVAALKGLSSFGGFFAATLVDVFVRSRLDA